MPVSSPGPSTTAPRKVAKGTAVLADARRWHPAVAVAQALRATRWWEATTAKVPGPYHPPSRATQATMDSTEPSTTLRTSAGGEEVVDYSASLIGLSRPEDGVWLCRLVGIGGRCADASTLSPGTVVVHVPASVLKQLRFKRPSISACWHRTAWAQHRVRDGRGVPPSAAASRRNHAPISVLSNSVAAPDRLARVGSNHGP